MERLKERLAVAQHALASFQEVLRLPTPTAFERDAAIQRFEYTVEATWRVAQRYLDIIEAFEAASPKATVRFSRQVGVLTDEEAAQALKMMDDRNLTVHTYHEEVAERIHSHLPRYAVLMEHWLAAIEARVAERERAGE